MSNQTCKKILFIHHGKGLGGAPLSLLYLIRSLDKHRFMPIVLFLHASEAMSLFKHEGIEILGPVKRNDFSHTKIWWFRWYHAPYFLRSCFDSLVTYLWTARKYIAKIKPDIVHLNTSSLIAWAAVSYEKKIPVVWHIREPLAAGYFGLRKFVITSCVNKFSSAIIPICNHDAQPWIKNAKTHVIYNPVDASEFSPDVSAVDFLQKYYLPPALPKILFLGGISSEKGTLFLLQAFEKVLAVTSQAQLLVAGYWDTGIACCFLKKFFPAYRYKVAVLRQVKKIEKSVVILGSIKNVPMAMAASRVVVFPATEGHFARPIIEAGFMKKPVVAPMIPPFDELVINGKTGFLYQPGNSSDLARLLSYIIHDEPTALRLGEDAYHFCFKKCNLKNYGKAVEKVYDGIARNGV